MRCGQNLQDSTNVSTGSSGSNSPAQSVNLFGDGSKSTIALILALGALLVLLLLNSVLQMRFERLNQQFEEADKRNELKIAVGVAEAVAVANLSRREAALAREDTIAIREAMAVKGILINQH